MLHGSIVLKLRALGWGPELDMLQQYHDSRLKEHKIVAVAKPLDDRSKPIVSPRCAPSNFKPRRLVLHAKQADGFHADHPR